jgi:hypothetical protein
MSSLGGPNIITNGLILSLDAANSKSYQSGSLTWYDKSGYNNNSRFIGTPSITGSNTQSSIFFTTGSQYLAVVNDQVVANNQFAWDTTGALGSSAITVELWVNSNQTVFPATFLFAKPWNGSGQYNYSIRILTNDSFQLRCQVGSGSFEPTITNVPIVDGTWKQIVLWINSTQIGYYINGNQYNGTFTHNISGSIPSSGNNALALTMMTLYPYGGGANPTFSITGSLSNVKYYNRALSASEITQNYNATKGRFNL